MLGAYGGDIIGSVFEWDNHRSKDFPLLTAANFVTDDSVMTAAVSEACLDWAEHHDERSFKDACVRDMQLLGGLFPDAGYGNHFWHWLSSDEPRPYNSLGNGSAMRVSPCGWIADSLTEAVTLGRWSAEVTHNHPEGIKGAEAVAAAVYLARTGSSQDEVRRHMERHYYVVDFTLAEIRADYTFDETCPGSVPQALAAFYEGDSYEDCVRNAISIGGDSDTLAAITGSIAEAAFGIPDWLQERIGDYLPDPISQIQIRFDEAIKARRQR